MNLDPALLEILVCPDCRAPLEVDDGAGELVCSGCGLAYPVRDDIPVLLVDEARRPAAPGDEAGDEAGDQAGDEARDEAGEAAGDGPADGERE